MALQKFLFSIILLFLSLSASAQTDSIRQPEKICRFNRGCRSIWKEMAFSGLPLTVASFGLKPRQEGFRQNNPDVDERTQLLHGFSTSVDNYIQYAPVAAVTIMNLAGYKGHTNRLRYLGTAAASFIIEAGLVNLFKYTVREPRPDGSSDNSWPSGHTATAFAGATLIHHEYGLTRSPWFSVAGYTVATGTAVLRVMNNRHWVNDVISGAGIGILSTEAAYALADFIFKDKGILLPYKDDDADLLEHPSFIGLSENFGVLRHSVNVGDRNFEFGFPVGVSVEGAYLINQYIGIGGRANFETSRLRNIETQNEYQTSFSYEAGPYFRYPLGNRFALATKFLIGREHNNGVVDTNTGDYLAISKNITYGTGLSLTFAYKHYYQWTVFCDYDISPRKYTLNNVYTTKKAWHSLLLGARLNIGF